MTRTDDSVKSLAKAFSTIAEMEQKEFTLIHLTRVEMPSLVTNEPGTFGYEVSFRKFIRDSFED